jgi:pimeloyl-ACP methyl ester carboxylesterase
MLILLLPAWVQAYEVVSEETTIEGMFSHTETLVAASPDPVNRFTMHRYRNRYLPEHLTQRVLLLVPGLQQHFNMYLDGFAQTIALSGIEVWAITPRTGSLTEACDIDPPSCAIAQTWTIDSVVDDVTYARDALETELPGRTVVFGGVSFGAMMAVAVANVDPDSYDGLLMIDGTLYSEDPVINGFNTFWCGMMNDWIASGIYYDGTQGDFALTLQQLAQADPDGPSPIMQGLTNRQAYVAFFDAPPPSPLSGAPGGRIFVADPASGTPPEAFLYADETLLDYAIPRFLKYVPIVMTRDIDCALAGNSPYVDNLAEFEGAIYAGGGEYGMGGMMADQLALFENADITEAIDWGYGHMDSYFSKTRFCDLTLPVITWIYGL